MILLIVQSKEVARFGFKNVDNDAIECPSCKKKLQFLLDDPTSKTKEEGCHYFY